MLFALPLVLAAAAPTASEAVLKLYRDACVVGEFQLTPQNGELVEGARMPSIALDFETVVPTKVLYIRMKEPADTDVVIEQFDGVPKAKFQSICRVASRSWAEREARMAFVDGVEGKFTVMDLRDAGHPFEPYEIDQPKTGLRKRLTIHDDWVVVETAIYKDAK
jgi:hypothetical protein